MGIKKTLLSFLHAFTFVVYLTDDSLPEVGFSLLSVPHGMDEVQKSSKDSQ